MRNLDFKYAGAWNFLPFGPEGIEINFKDYGNIVLVEGINKDSKIMEPGEDELDMRSNSNGTGKSSVQEILVYAIYGKTIKRPEKINIDDVIHNKVGSDCKCIVEFDKYRIVRTRMENGKKNKNNLRLWESEEKTWDDSTEITLGSMSATQKKIDEIVGLSYESFINICIFTDDQRSCFLECDKNTKREIVENLLSLGSYREWFESSKEAKKEIKSQIDSETKEFSMLLNNQEDSEKRLRLTKSKEDQWNKQKQQEIDELKIKLKDKKEELKNKSNVGEALSIYQEAQENIQKINEEIPKIGTQKKELQDKIILVDQKETEQREYAQSFSEKFNDLSREIKYKLEEKKKLQKEIEELKKEEPGKKCIKCKGIVSVKNIDEYILELEKEISNIDLIIKEEIPTLKVMEEESKQLKLKQNKLKEMKSQIEEKIIDLDSKSEKLRKSFLEHSKVKEPRANDNEIAIKQKIEEIMEHIKKTESDKDSPFKDILQNDEQELKKIKNLVEEKKEKIKSLEEKIPYYDYWISGFGEQGIRKWIIEGIIPDLNKRINYWLQFLIDNVITLNFDNELQEKIERNPPDGDPYIYYAMSTGQRRRLNLAVGHSFAYITELSSDSVPSLIFLDEVTTNVDPSGVVGIYKMIRELAESKQVFVTTHDQDLIKMLETESKLKLVHENGFTKKL
jgi:DNA repair exonuclease SbcCD ATPase subunit